ncbi:unnamed protein product [Darwinula stevensoni]|uniref:Uncharacterized protein n=1 Tax=Darwinula stevensoni TaxID=69355 RepID=A0A7R8ZY56_9CRUS|nr:unnamed protein product [Darwinula stevensoni]CAG0879757.1 unnamed protein product [Darwinula stevensoni]
MKGNEENQWLPIGRVVPDQRAKFESDDLIRKLSRESEVRYTGYRDRPVAERRSRFETGCKDGHTEIGLAGHFLPAGRGLSTTDLDGIRMRSLFSLSVRGSVSESAFSAIRGHEAEEVYLGSGINFHLVFPPISCRGLQGRPADFDSDPGKVHLTSQFILNGVCVRWRGWIDIDRLEGLGAIEFDESSAQLEEAALLQQRNRFVPRFREFPPSLFHSHHSG